MSDDAEIATMIDDCTRRQHKLTEWEQSFVDDMEAQVSRGRALNGNQKQKLEEIWEKATS